MYFLVANTAFTVATRKGAFPVKKQLDEAAVHEYPGCLEGQVTQICIKRYIYSYEKHRRGNR